LDQIDILSGIIEGLYQPVRTPPRNSPKMNASLSRPRLAALEKHRRQPEAVEGA
jgi:hypothetical protein